MLISVGGTLDLTKKSLRYSSALVYFSLYLCCMVGGIAILS